MNKEEKNNLLITGVVLSVLLPPIGLILCLIALNDIKKNNKPGENLAINGIMVSILVTIVLIGVSIFLVVHHNKKVEEQEQKEAYIRELRKACELRNSREEYSDYDPERPNKKTIQCRDGDCFMYKGGKPVEMIDCDIGY